jgi:DNA-binding NarL/FixJ family response regulator
LQKSKPLMEEHAAHNIKLTRREKTILQEVALGRTTPQIAEALGLSPETVKWYRKQLLVKFSAATSAEVVRKAVQNEII